MHYREDADWHLARSHVYGLLGGLLSTRPEEETLGRLLRPETVEHLAALFAEPEVAAGLRRLAAQYQAREMTAEQVAVDFEGLMRVPGALYTHPFESSYRARREEAKGPKWGPLCSAEARDVERCYRSEGLVPEYGRVDFADHIGAELAFMAHLCGKAAEAMQAGEEEAAGRLRAKLREFAQTHMLEWAGDFSAELRAKAATPFYRAVADMLAAFLDLEKDQLAVH